MADKQTRRNLGEILSIGAMAMGEGITGRPYLTNYQNMQLKRQELDREANAKQAFLDAINGGQLNGQAPTGGMDDKPQFIKVPDYNSPIGFKLELDPRWISKVSSQQQIETATNKENSLVVSKAERLGTVGDTVKNQWLKTSPYKGLITKTGLVPALGMWDVLKKGIGATDAQQRDQVYANFVKGVRAQLARGMGDVGNLSEPEQVAVAQLLPTLMDSYESGIKKFEQISQLVADIKKRRGGDKGVSNFVVGGISYDIPKDKVEAFKKAKGIK